MAPPLKRFRSETNLQTAHHSNLQVSAHDFDCPVCQELLFNPIATPCGHTFCQICIARQTNPVCPMCRETWPTTLQLRPNIIMRELIEKTFPELTRKRGEELREELQLLERVKKKVIFTSTLTNGIKNFRVSIDSRTYPSLTPAFYIDHVEVIKIDGKKSRIYDEPYEWNREKEYLAPSVSGRVFFTRGLKRDPLSFTVDATSNENNEVSIEVEFPKVVLEKAAAELPPVLASPNRNIVNVNSSPVQSPSPHPSQSPSPSPTVPRRF